MADISLRDVRRSDLAIFFEHQQDAAASKLAAVASRDRAAFDAHWARILVDPTIVKKTVLVDGETAGNMVSFERGGLREVGYWLGRAFWGRGAATRALTLFLPLIKERPLYARAAKSNAASLRVLQKCGFAAIGEESFDFEGRRVEELLLELR